MRLWLVAILALLSVQAVSAGDFKLIELDGVYADYKHFLKGTRDPLFFDGLPPKEEVNLHLDTTILEYFFFNNMVHGMTNDAQYHLVGWNMKLGFRLSSYIDIQYEHFSKHILDNAYPYMKFPVQDSVGFTLYFYRKDKKESLF